jgi:hypothetical protein
MPSFDPQRITPAVSLNRVQIVDLPGLAVDPGVRGQRSSQLVSLAVLARLVRLHADSLQLNPDVSDSELRLALENCLADERATVRSTAERVGRRMGRHLGYILLALKRGDAVNRAARSEWDDSYWQHWSKIKRIWLGGGLASGRLGAIIQKHASSVIEEAGVGDYLVRVSPYASVLPLVGAARRAPPGSKTALVLDFGSTMVKRARAAYSENELIELRCLPSQRTGWSELERASDDPVQQGSELLNSMVSIIAEACQTIGLPAYGPVLACAAAYMRDGHPLPTQGGTYLTYLKLRRITDNAQRELAWRAGARLGRAIDLRLMHDGTAAATAYAGMRDTAVIMVGTALGVGFPPESRGLLAINPNLAILGLDISQ